MHLFCTLCRSPLPLLNKLVENFWIPSITYFRAKLLYIYLYTRKPVHGSSAGPYTELGGYLGTTCGHVHWRISKGWTIESSSWGTLIPTVLHRFVYHLGNTAIYIDETVGKRCTGALTDKPGNHSLHSL